MTVKLFEVGGCVRDELLGIRPKDLDYTVVASGYAEMESYLVANGFEIFDPQPKYLRITARFPKDTAETRSKVADFVLSRKEGFYHDGRHPDSVEPGTLEDDLRRRDFTVNAMARDEDGSIIDLFGGMQDLRDGVLRAVGDAEARLREDALRALRAVRFSVTKALRPNEELADALRSEWLPPLLASVSVERKREELLKAFKHDTLVTMEMLMHLGADFREAVFTDGLWLAPSLKGRKV